jgi:hypothetical protein
MLCFLIATGAQVHRNYQRSMSVTRSVPSNKKRVFSQLGRLHEKQETTQLVHELKRLKTELPGQISKEISAALSKNTDKAEEIEAVVCKQLGEFL